MRNRRLAIYLALAILLIFQPSCRNRPATRMEGISPTPLPVVTKIEYPDLQSPAAGDFSELSRPLSVDLSKAEAWPLSLHEAIAITLENSQVIRDSGGRLLNAPNNIATAFDAALVETDPRFGVERALSAFDAQLGTRMFWGRNERAINNAVQAGTPDVTVFALNQDTANFAAGFSKIGATGTSYTLNKTVLYDSNNRGRNLYPSVFDSIIEARVRHPLMQGAGVEFNRIAGPNAQPGLYNGLLIARTNTDMSIANFELAIRDLLAQVERTYWLLYFAYRDFDAKVAGRQAALETWRLVEQRAASGLADPEQEARAREQFFLFEIEVTNATAGTNLGGGAAAVFGGIVTIEQRLRALMGVPPDGKTLIRPTNDPTSAPVSFNWDSSLASGLVNRVELRRQKWAIKQRELQLIAARNFLKPRIDFVSAYRWRGLGDNLLGEGDPPLATAVGELLDGDYQEWELGFEVSQPVGNRIGHVAVRNACLGLARDQKVLEQQQLAVVHELSSSFTELDRTFKVMQQQRRRNQAARQQLEYITQKHLARLAQLEFVLDAQARATQAESDYHRSVVTYNLAILEVHKATGQLLPYLNVALAEGRPSPVAHSAAEYQAQRLLLTPR